ncbi:MAG: phospholipid carrier-dependent glycosyltransferase [bacterium]|nr:phospholipid carrier-dependent glycosyltransferase [Candidatus Kapabacteria bacterium]
MTGTPRVNGRYDRLLTVASLLIVAAYVIYAAVFIHVPVVNNDEVWMLTRGEHLSRTGVVAEPTMSEQVSPFFANLFSASAAGPISGYVYYGTLAMGFLLNDADPVTAYRFLMLLWSIVVVVMTYAVARALGIDRVSSLVSLAWLVVVPEFVGQAHCERFEMLLALGVLCGALLMLKAFQAKEPTARRMWLAAAALFAWMPAIFIHYSGICLPAVLAAMYIAHDWRKLWSIEALILAILLVPGMLLFADLVLAPAKLTGGVFGLTFVGPPILSKSLWYFIKTPLHLFERMQAINVTSRMVSSLWFVLSIAAAVWLWRRPERRIVTIVATVVLATIASLVLASGSTGPYVIIVAPWAAIMLGLATKAFVEKFEARRTGVVAFIVVPTAIFCSNLIGLGFYSEQKQVFAKLQSDVARVVPPGKSVLAQPLYYLALRPRPFTASVWTSAFSGRPDQSFEQGVAISGSEYLVIDELMVAMALKGARDSTWMADMMRFLETKCVLVEKIQTHYTNATTRIAGTLNYPAPWSPIDPGFIQRVYIYRVLQKEQTL